MSEPPNPDPRLLIAAIEAAAEGIVITDCEGRILWVNPAFTAQTGYTREEAIGNTPRVLKSGKHPPEFYENLWKTVLAGCVWRDEIINRRKDGSFYTEEMTITPIRLDGGEITHFVALKPDITSRKRAEEERLRMERRVMDAQSLASLGVLAGGVAHRYNNLLTAILGNLELALEGIPPELPERQSLLGAQQAATQAAELTRQMLALSGRGRFEVRWVDLSALVSDSVELLRVPLTAGATLDLALASGLPPVIADPGQLQQAALNLVTNASEALGGGQGNVTVSTGVAEFGAAELARSRLLEMPLPGKFVYLEVTDTGCGMNEGTVQRVFEPFFTTKFAGRGLGLSAVQGIARGHRGAVLVESRPGAGTRVRVLIPVAQA